MLNSDDEKHKAKLIMNTSSLLLSQVQILLDKSLVDSKHFKPQLHGERLLETIGDTIDILKGQASLKNLELQFQPMCKEFFLMIDSMRVK